MSEIHTAMLNIMADLGAIGKERAAPAVVGGYAYRGIDDVMAALQPLLIRHAVLVFPKVYEVHKVETCETPKGPQHMVTVTMEYHWVSAKDGSELVTSVVSQGMDSREKGAFKMLAGAFKYCATQALCCPTEESKDPESDEGPSIAPPRGASAPAGKTRAAAPAARPVPTPQQVGELVYFDEPLGFSKKFREHTWRQMTEGSPNGERMSFLQYLVDNADNPPKRNSQRAAACLAVINARFDREAGMGADDVPEFVDGDAPPWSGQ